jgi:hypothetical protein
VYFRLFFNPARPAMEHLVRAIPSAVRMGLQDFAGKPIRGWSRFAREIAPALARYGPDAALRMLPGHAGYPGRDARSEPACHEGSTVER